MLCSLHVTLQGLSNFFAPPTLCSAHSLLFASNSCVVSAHVTRRVTPRPQYDTAVSYWGLVVTWRVIPGPQYDTPRHTEIPV